MKSPKFFLALLILFFSFQISGGQEAPKAEMFDEMENLFCTEDNRSRLDSFLIEIRNTPGAKGYVIGYGDAAIPGRFLKYYEALQNQTRFRKFPADKIVFLRGDNRTAMIFQFWIVPAGAPIPKPEKEYNFAKITSPTIYDKSLINSISGKRVVFGDGSEEPCDWGLNLKEFANRLERNADLNGQLVAYSNSAREKTVAEKALRLSVQKLISEYKISPRRLRIIYGGARAEREMELWLVPQKKSN